ncbi:MAG: zinc ribbon domain-containing protein [Treponema sp.]|nr:zinc ribbon domain-containing protein [Treponema sp.]
MSAQSTKPKYFCENCGEEVAANARFCPHCGKFFAAVRCPSCGYMGSQNDFKNGCPRCHYAMSQEDIYGPGQVPSFLQDKKAKKSKKKKKAHALSSASRGAGTGNDVPTWLLFVSIAVLIGLVIALLNIKS